MCFEYCTALEAVDCSNIHVMDSLAFNSCENLTQIRVRNGILIQPHSGEAAKVATFNNILYWACDAGASTEDGISIWISEATAGPHTPTLIGVINPDSPTLTHQSITFRRTTENNFTITW